MLTPDQLAALRAAAAAATPGPWEYQTSNGWWRVGTTAARCGRADGDVVAHGAASPANLEFIAAANPAVVLALLAHIDTQAVRIAELERDAARYRWLRSDDIEVLPGQREICAVRFPLPSDEDAGEEVLFESELDAAIDAAMQPLTCTCPSGDGSLRWPCPRHPPESA
ncbi:ead/Ea22-like family protein [Chromobacterium subtsugae]|uniref:ead/Ea22-like family protein n=1 Tax=Chromobacterium subtsugae TaxID=251747 RepID=UPI000640ECD6|nr:ead/Ea22-like family protein [Chromobacterium subtsugae]